MYDYKAKIVEWHDADTVKLVIDQGFGEAITCWVRFYGCWAKENGTPEGDAALGWVEQYWPAGTDVYVLTRKPTVGGVEFEGKQLGQTFARWLGIVYPSHVLDGSIGEQLIRNGFATLTKSG